MTIEEDLKQATKKLRHTEEKFKSLHLKIQILVMKSEVLKRILDFQLTRLLSSITN